MGGAWSAGEPGTHRDATLRHDALRHLRVDSLQRRERVGLDLRTQGGSHASAPPSSETLQTPRRAARLDGPPVLALAADGGSVALEHSHVHALVAARLGGGGSGAEAPTRQRAAASWQPVPGGQAAPGGRAGSPGRAAGGLSSAQQPLSPCGDNPPFQGGAPAPAQGRQCRRPPPARAAGARPGRWGRQEPHKESQRLRRVGRKARSAPAAAGRARAGCARRAARSGTA